MAVFEVAYFNIRYAFNVARDVTAFKPLKPTETLNTTVGLWPSDPLWAHGRMFVLILELTMIQPHLTYFVNLNCL
jgi:hypothetical protein